ncbi:MAG: Microtubule-severing ATPase, partial [Methanolobus sp. T82-4]
MTSAITLAAQARGYSKAAKELEDSGQPERARQLYLKAAKLYNDAYTSAGDEMDRNTQRDLAEHLFAKAQ